MAGERGSGAGKGGGTGGTIRDAGGSFGKMEAAHEDQYFYNLVSVLSLFLTFFALTISFAYYISLKISF